MHSSLEDEGGIYLKPIMVTGKKEKRAVTAEAHFVSVCKIVARWKHKTFLRERVKDK